MWVNEGTPTMSFVLYTINVKYLCDASYVTWKYRQFKRYHVIFVRKYKTFQKIDIPGARFNRSGTSFFHEFHSSCAWRGHMPYGKNALFLCKPSSILLGIDQTNWVYSYDDKKGSPQNLNFINPGSGVPLLWCVQISHIERMHFFFFKSSSLLQNGSAKLSI